MAATNRKEPNPPKRYVNVFLAHREGGGVGVLGPTSLSLRAAPSDERPCCGEL